MKDIHVVDSLDALRAMSDPLRMQILECLRKEARTAGQIARRLGQPANKLHYHVSEMEKHGLIEAVETRRKGNLLETYYGRVARFYRVENSLFAGGGSGSDALEVFYQTVATILNTAVIHLRDDIDTGRVTEREAAASKRGLLRARLHPSDAAEFRERLDALVQEFGERSSPDIDDWIALTLVYYPLTAEKDEEPATTIPSEDVQGDVYEANK